MNRINEIGDTPKGQYMLGQVHSRAHRRLQDLPKDAPFKEIQKYSDIMDVAHSEASCPPNRKVHRQPIINDKGQETTHYAQGWWDYDNAHFKTNENKQYTNMNKKLIKLTEQDLHRIVRESVQNILKENEGNDLVKLLPQVTGAIRNAEMMLDEVDLPENFGNQLGDGGINTIKQIRDYLDKASNLCVMLYQEHAFGRKNYLPRDGGDREQRDYSGLSGWGG